MSDLNKVTEGEYNYLFELISQNIKYLRRRNTISQDELSLRTEISVSDIQAIENCEKEASLRELYALARGLNTSMMILVAG